MKIHQKSPDYLFSGEPGSGQAEVSDCSVRGEQQDHGHQYLGSGEDDDDDMHPSEENKYCFVLQQGLFTSTFMNSISITVKMILISNLVENSSL